MFKALDNPAPLVRKKTKKTVAYQSPTATPGVQHVVEGRDLTNLFTYDVKRPSMINNIGKSSQYTWGGVGPNTDRPGAKEEIDQGIHNRETDEKIALYTKEDAARARIKPIADPDENKSEERKKAARRRMRGRLGSLLSQRESQTKETVG